MRRRLILATRSADKAREIHEILAPRYPHAIVTLSDAGVAEDTAENDIEIFDSFLDNAHAKADYFLRLTGSPTIADDSGISVDALGGAPGVHSRRFAQRTDLSGVALDHANNERLLRELEASSAALRSAHYTCAAVLHLPDGRRFAALGTCSGSILHQPRGSHGFGYDPLFQVVHTGRTFGEMSGAEKHRYSHRARAFRALASVIDHSSVSR
ncbi:MAG TPA: non-canonical purine NTP pyrophosphatase [Longimicrobiales bacterium]